MRPRARPLVLQPQRGVLDFAAGEDLRQVRNVPGPRCNPSYEDAARYINIHRFRTMDYSQSEEHAAFPDHHPCG